MFQWTLFFLSLTFIYRNLRVASDLHHHYAGHYFQSLPSHNLPHSLYTQPIYSFIGVPCFRGWVPCYLCCVLLDIFASVCLMFIPPPPPLSHLFYSLYIPCILSFSPSASSRYYPTASPSSSSSVQINVAPRPAPDTVHPSLPHHRIAYHTRSNTSIPLVDTPPRVRVVLEAKPASRESN